MDTCGEGLSYCLKSIKNKGLLRLQQSFRFVEKPFLEES